MPLLDHYRSLDTTHYQWQSFYSAWAVTLMARLNTQLLSEQYHALLDLRYFSKIKGDTESADYSVAPAFRMPGILSQSVAVPIYDREDGRSLVGVIEWVCPENKNSDMGRRAFAHKCSSLLQRGIGLVVIDIVTDQTANLHNEFVRRMGLDETFRLSFPNSIYAVSYHAVRLDDREEIEVWPAALEVGAEISTMPLKLRGGPMLTLPLEDVYMEARRGSAL